MKGKRSVLMLEKLKNKVDVIREDDEWAADFVENIVIQKQQMPDTPLTKKQFRKLCEIYERYKRG